MARRTLRGGSVVVIHAAVYSPLIDRPLWNAQVRTENNRTRSSDSTALHGVTGDPARVVS
jgi:hypothetical protein